MRKALWQIGLRVPAFREFFQSRLDCGLGEQIAEDIDLAAKFVIRNRLDEFFGDAGRPAVKLSELSGGATSCFQRLALRHYLADQSRLLRFRRIEASSGKQQVAHHGIAEIALQAGNTAESGDQAQTQFGKAETRHFVGDDQVANQSKLEPSAKSYAVDRGDRGQR